MQRWNATIPSVWSQGQEEDCRGLVFAMTLGICPPWPEGISEELSFPSWGGGQ